MRNVGSRGIINHIRGDPNGQDKERKICFIERLPEDATWEDMMAELYFKIKVDSGLKELDEGKGIPHAEVKERIKYINIF